MAIRAEEITQLIRTQVRDYDKRMEVAETGTVLSVGDGIARIFGLENVMAGELLSLPHDVFGIALNLEESNVGAALFGNDVLIKEGDTVRRTGRIAEVPVGEAMVGRVVNALGVPVDGKGEVKTEERRNTSCSGSIGRRTQTPGRGKCSLSRGPTRTRTRCRTAGGCRSRAPGSRAAPPSR